MELNRFLRWYLEYTSGNETPESMHLWAGLSVLAGAAEKRIWIPVGFSKEGLNLYVILLGPPGVVAKSTALKLAKQLLQKGKFNVMEGAVTKEKIAEEMSEMMRVIKLGEGRVVTQTPVTYISNEIFTLLSSGMDMVKFLTDIWNEETWVYRTKTAGEYVIPNVCFNLLAATTPQWFSTNVFSDLSSSGFLARCIIIYETTPRGSFPFFVASKEQEEAMGKLLEMLEEIKGFYGPIEMSQEAAEFYADWYVAQKIPIHEDHRLASYLERKKKIFVYKVSALLAIGDLRMKIAKKDVEMALELFDRIERKMRLAFMAMGDNAMIALIFRTLAFLQERPFVPERKVVQFLARDIDVETYKRLREQMLTLGLISLSREGKTNYILLNEEEAKPFLEGLDALQTESPARIDNKAGNGEVSERPSRGEEERQ